MRNEKLHAGISAMQARSVPELLTRKQVAELFQVSPLTIIRLEAAGKLPAVKVGAGSIRYKREDVEAFIEQAKA
jgi:excisionase family DNA binding protein